MTIKNWYGGELEVACNQQIDRLVDKARWASHMLAFIHELDPIEHLVVTDSRFFNEELRDDKNHMPVLRLDYSGEALNQEDARADLADIMHCVGTLFGDLEPCYISGNKIPDNHGYGGAYEGPARFGGVDVMVRLEVPWMPHTCQLIGEPSTYKPDPINWTIKCPTREIED